MDPPFDFELPPFDRLSVEERALLAAAAQPAAYAAGDTLQRPGEVPAAAFVITTGHVERRAPAGAADDDVGAVHGPGSLLGVRALLAGHADAPLAALTEVRALRLPKPLLQSLLAANGPFAAAVFAQASQRLAVPAERRQRGEMAAMMSARVGDVPLRTPLRLPAAADLLQACREMAAHGVTHALVDGEATDGTHRTGIFTTTDLRDALLRTPAAGGRVDPAAITVGEVARFQLITVRPDDEVFVALLLMLRHRVHRLVVRDGDRITGVLGQLDLMSYISNHSHLIAIEIDQATSIEQLRSAAGRIDELIAALESNGVRVRIVAALVRELNARLFERLWSLLTPAELVANSCVVVMGSEGRGEQILKTDQDNALLLRDGFECAELDAISERFVAALVAFGYPPCPGRIMLNNPLWRQPLAAFRDTMRGWVHGAGEDGPMHMAIFLDAVAVAGDARLLDAARAQLMRLLPDSDAFLARFARPADQFDEPGGGWRSWLSPLTAPLGSRGARKGRDDESFDLKKLGTFPIVHGVRALALQHRVAARGTAERLQALVDKGVYDKEGARDLTEALHLLMRLKLEHNLRQRRLAQALDNTLHVGELGSLEADALKEALAIIRRFRQWLRQHFRLDAL